MFSCASCSFCHFYAWVVAWLYLHLFLLNCVFFLFFSKQNYTEVQSTAITQSHNKNFKTWILHIIIPNWSSSLAENPFDHLILFDLVRIQRNVKQWETIKQAKRTLHILNIKCIKTKAQTNKQTKNSFPTQPVCFSQCIVKLLVKYYL